MLVLTRKENEQINIGANIKVVVLGIEGNRVRLGLIAPAQIPILREELRVTDASMLSARTSKPQASTTDGT